MPARDSDRERMLQTRAEDNAVAVAYVNLVGGQDELVFDGQSLVIDERGRTIARGRAFEEELLVVEINTERVFKERLHDPRGRQERFDGTEDEITVEQIFIGDVNSERTNWPIGYQGTARPKPLDRVEEVYRALVIGTRDYVTKNGFRSVVIGLSGGIDSALTACIAVDALGPQAVTCVFMPTRYSSSESGARCRSIWRAISALSLPRGSD